MYPDRLKWFYDDTVKPDFIRKYGVANIYEVPRFSRIILHASVGLNAAKHGSEVAVKRSLNVAKNLPDEQLVGSCTILHLLTGQNVQIKRCKTPVANFHIRKGDALGCQVVLYGSNMLNFLDEMITVIWPRNTRPDFGGVQISGVTSHDLTASCRAQTRYVLPSDEHVSTLLFQHDLFTHERDSPINTARSHKHSVSNMQTYTINIGFTSALVWPSVDAYYDLLSQDIGFQVTIEIQARCLLEAQALCSAVQIPYH